MFDWFLNLPLLTSNLPLHIEKNENENNNHVTLQIFFWKKQVARYD